MDQEGVISELLVFAEGMFDAASKAATNMRATVACEEGRIKLNAANATGASLSAAISLCDALMQQVRLGRQVVYSDGLGKIVYTGVPPIFPYRIYFFRYLALADAGAAPQPGLPR